MKPPIDATLILENQSEWAYCRWIAVARGSCIISLHLWMIAVTGGSLLPVLMEENQRVGEGLHPPGWAEGVLAQRVQYWLWLYG